jgi:hypothetical protein
VEPRVPRYIGHYRHRRLTRRREGASTGAAFARRAEVPRVRSRADYDGGPRLTRLLAGRERRCPPRRGRRANPHESSQGLRSSPSSRRARGRAWRRERATSGGDARGVWPRRGSGRVRKSDDVGWRSTRRGLDGTAPTFCAPARAEVGAVARQQVPRTPPDRAGFAVLAAGRPAASHESSQRGSSSRTSRRARGHACRRDRGDAHGGATRAACGRGRRVGWMALRNAQGLRVVCNVARNALILLDIRRRRDRRKSGVQP